jgi:hypothetical protein
MQREESPQHDPISTEDLVRSGTSPEDTARADTDVDDVTARHDLGTPSTIHSERTGSDALAEDRGDATANSDTENSAASTHREAEPTGLIEDAEGARFRSRWHAVQEEFVDDPRRAVQDADQLVAELMQTLATTFAERKRSLEDQWRSGGDAETEDLRLALRSYRSFFDQLLPQ